MVDWTLKSGTIIRTESQLVFNWNIHCTDTCTHTLRLFFNICVSKPLAVRHSLVERWTWDL